MMQIQEEGRQETMVLGRLMSPGEVRAATEDNATVPQALRSEWFLCGDVPEPFMRGVMRDSDVLGYRLSGFTTRQCGYAMLTVQSAAQQVRFLMQLGGDKCSRFLTGAASHGVMLSLATLDSRHAVVRRFEMDPSHFAPLAQMSRLYARCSALAAIEDLVQATTAATELSRLPSALPGYPVESAHVVLIVPDALSDTR